MEYGTGRGNGPGGTKRRVFKNDEERKQPTLKKTNGKFLITFD